MAYISGGITEIQEVRRELEEIKRLMDEMQPQLEKAPRQLENFRKLEAVARRYLILANRMGFKGNVMEAIRETSQLIVTLQQARIAAHALHAALFLGGGPLGLIMAGASVGLVATSVMGYAQDQTHDATWGV